MCHFILVIVSQCTLTTIFYFELAPKKVFSDSFEVHLIFHFFHFHFFIYLCDLLCYTLSRVSDPHGFNVDPDTDPDPAIFLIADPDPGSGSRVW
jgi:hypothetical protein